MKKTWLVGSFLLVPSLLMAGSLERDLKKCGAIKVDEERLACFDLVNDKYDVMTDLKPVQPNNIGQWQLTSKINPMDDSKMALAVLNSDTIVSRDQKPVTLVVRCKSNKTQLFVNWRSELDSDVKIMTRLGGAEPALLNWTLSEDNRATFRSWPIDFVKKMMKVDTLSIQAKQTDKPAITVKFDLEGVGNALKEVRKACNW